MQPHEIKPFGEYLQLKRANPGLDVEGSVEEQALDNGISEIYDYCTGVARYQEHGTQRTRAIKNIVAAVGTIAGGIIAPVFAEGSAIAAWASVSGASSSVLSRMFDNATSSPVQGLSGERATVAQELLHTQTEIGKATEYEKKAQLGQRLFLFCRLHDYRTPRKQPGPNDLRDTNGAQSPARNQLESL